MAIYSTSAKPDPGLGSCNPTICPLYPILSTMLQVISQYLLPFITTIIKSFITSDHVPTAWKRPRVIPIQTKPTPGPSDISKYQPKSFKASTVICSFFSHRKPPILSLASKQHSPLKLPLRSSQRSSMLLYQPNCHQSSYSTLQQRLIQDSLVYPHESWNFHLSMVTVHFLPGRSVISSEGNHVCFTQSLHWHPSGLGIGSSSVLPP